MAKNRSKNRNSTYSKSKRRVVNTYASFQTQRKLPKPITLRTVEDLRTYHPLKKLRPLRQLQGRKARIRATVPNFKKYARSVIYRASKDTLVCVRRNIRKEVLHAFKRTGRGSGRSKPRYNFNSKIRC